MYVSRAGIEMTINVICHWYESTLSMWNKPTIVGRVNGKKSEESVSRFSGAPEQILSLIYILMDLNWNLVEGAPR